MIKHLALVAALSVASTLAFAETPTFDPAPFDLLSRSMETRDLQYVYDATVRCSTYLAVVHIKFSSMSPEEDWSVVYDTAEELVETSAYLYSTMYMQWGMIVATEAVYKDIQAEMHRLVPHIRAEIDEQFEIHGDYYTGTLEIGRDQCGKLDLAIYTAINEGQLIEMPDIK